jgi:hypothetical protein
MDWNDSSASLPAASTCLKNPNSCGGARVQLINLVLCSEGSHRHFGGGELVVRSRNPEANLLECGPSKRVRREAPEVDDELPGPFTVKVRSRFEGSAQTIVDVSGEDTVAGLWLKLAFTVNQSLMSMYAPPFSESPSFKLDGQVGRVQVTLPPLSKLSFHNGSDLFRSLGFRFDETDEEENTGTFVNGDPTRAKLLESSVIENIATAKIGSLVSAETVFPIKVKLRISPLFDTYNYEASLSPSLETSAGAETLIRKCFRILVTNLIRVWNFKEHSLQFSLVPSTAPPASEGDSVWGLKLTAGPSRTSIPFKLEMRFGTEIQKILGLSKPKIEWNTRNGDRAVTGLTVVTKGSSELGTEQQREIDLGMLESRLESSSSKNCFRGAPSYREPTPRRTNQIAP